MKAKTKPEQYGWKLKKVNDPEFWDWYENQDNIGESLFTLIKFFIKQYGTVDVKSFEAQQAMHRDLLMKDEFYQEFNRMKILLQDNTVVSKMITEQPSVQNIESSKDESEKKDESIEEETKKEVKQETPKSSLFGAVNRDNIV